MQYSGGKAKSNFFFSIDFQLMSQAADFDESKLENLAWIQKRCRLQTEPKFWLKLIKVKKWFGAIIVHFNADLLISCAKYVSFKKSNQIDHDHSQNHIYCSPSSPNTPSIFCIAHVHPSKISKIKLK